MLPAVPPAPAEDPPQGEGRPLAALGALLWREDACGQVELVAGTCPATATELLLSDRSAADVGVVAGDQVLLPDLADEPAPAGSDEPFPVAYTVSGVYRAASVDTASRFWFDGEVTEYAPATVFDGEQLPARLDAVLVTRELAGGLRVPGTTIRVQRALRPGGVSLDDVDGVRRDLAAHVAYLEGTSGAVAVESRLVGTLERAVPGRLLVGRTAQLVGLQVVLVGWFVLFVVVGLVTATRERELALAKVRGVRGPGLLRLALGEPVTLLALAVPLGVVVATAGTAAAAGRALLPGTWDRLLGGDPAALWGPVAVAVGATVAGGAVASALAARRAVRAPVDEQLRRTDGEQAVLGPVATAVLVTVLVVGLVLVRTLGSGAATTLPALLVPVGAGVVAGLLVAAAVRRAAVLARRGTRSAALAPFLAVRQVAARGGLTRSPRWSRPSRWWRVSRLRRGRSPPSSATPRPASTSAPTGWSWSTASTCRPCSPPPPWPTPTDGGRWPRRSGGSTSGRRPRCSRSTPGASTRWWPGSLRGPRCRPAPARGSCPTTSWRR